MKYRIAVSLMVLVALTSCSHKKKGLLLFLPAGDSSTPALSNTVETPVSSVAPTTDTFLHETVTTPAAPATTPAAPATTPAAPATTPTAPDSTTGNPGTTTGETATTGSGTGTGDSSTGTSSGTDGSGNKATTGTDSTPPATSGGTGNSGNEGTGSTATNGGNGAATSPSGSEANPGVAVAHISESEFRSDGIPMTDCFKNLPIPSLKENSVKYDSFEHNLCEIGGVWYIVLPWSFKDGSFKMKIEKKIPHAKYLLAALMGTYAVDGYKDRLFPQRFATPPYTPVYNVNYTDQNWLISDQDVFLIDIQKHAWINFDRNYALFRIFVGDREVTNLYGLKDANQGKSESENGNKKEGDDSDLSQYKDGTSIRLTASNQRYVIAPPPSTITAYLLQSYEARTFIQTASLGALALGLMGLILVLYRRRKAAQQAS